MSNPRFVVAVSLGLLLLSGCNRNPLLVKRSLCPAVAVPNYTGETTLFTAGGNGDAANIDVVAAITDVRGACIEEADKLGTNVTFNVEARRTSTIGARTVTLPFFATIVQGGNLLVSKQLGAVTINFADGQLRAQAAGAARSEVARSAATLKADTQNKISRVRKPGDADAAVDPLADPEVKAAIRASTFEVLIGFQLDDDALAYNAAK